MTFILKLNQIFPIMFFFITTFFLAPAVSQNDFRQKDQYQIGPDERLFITVHIWGEVRKPGEYFVPDDTNILELISKAGGPTEYSNLSHVKITRGLLALPATLKKQRTNPKKKSYHLYINKKEVIKIDLNKILDNQNYLKNIPVLQPGDTIRIGRNTWFKWQAVIRVISQLAIVAQVWYWYNRE